MSTKGKPHTIAKVFHNYQAQSDNELCLTKGESIKVFEKFPNGWWVGETSDGKLGVFPGTYVKEIPNDNNKPIINQITSVQKQNESINSSNDSSSIKNQPEKKKIRKKIPISQANVLYDYTGQTETELSLKKGTIINIYRKLQNDGWWQGEYEGKYGHFPAKYVQEIIKDKDNKPPEKEIKEQKHENTKIKTIENINDSKSYFAIALYDYKGDNEDELSFKKGDEIFTSIKIIDNDWAQGICGNQYGNFPIKYVAKVNISNLADSNSDNKMAIAMYNFQALDPSEINLQKGSVLKVIEEGAPEAWWKGEFNNKIGHFPGNYVKLLPLKSYVLSKLLTVDKTIQDLHLTETTIDKEEDKKEKTNKKELSDQVNSITDNIKDLSINDNKSIDNSTDIQITDNNDTANDSSGIISDISNKEDTSTNEIINDNNIVSKTNIKKQKKTKKKEFVKQTPIGTCIALYDYKGSNKYRTLSFQAGDVLNIYKRQLSGWWKGEFNENIGFFPSSYIREKTTTNQKEKKQKQTFIVKAILNYNGSSETELSFKKNDLFYQYDYPIENGWAKGEKDGKKGHFPITYVECINSSQQNDSSNEIQELREMIITLSKKMNSQAPNTIDLKSPTTLSSPNIHTNTDNNNKLLFELKESEKLRKQQQKELELLSSKVEVLSTKVTKQADTISKQQKTIRRLSKQNHSTSSTSSGDVEKLREYLDIEVRQRRDLESIIRKLETHHETLARQVIKLQRHADKKETKEKIGKKKLRHTGIDLTK